MLCMGGFRTEKDTESAKGREMARDERIERNA